MANFQFQYKGYTIQKFYALSDSHGHLVGEEYADRHEAQHYRTTIYRDHHIVAACAIVLDEDGNLDFPVYASTMGKAIREVKHIINTTI